jgi:hypothetical protein
MSIVDTTFFFKYFSFQPTFIYLEYRSFTVYSVCERANDVNKNGKSSELGKKARKSRKKEDTGASHGDFSGIHLTNNGAVRIIYN